MLKVNLYDYQKTGVNFAMKARYAILGDSMGLGKTLQALAISSITKYKTLVVCPTFLQKVWQNEIEKCLTEHSHIRLTTYSKLKNSESLFEWAEFVICDEAHYLKNPKALRTKGIHYYIEKYRPKLFLCLTGTPIKNRITEFYSLLLLMDKCPVDTNGKRLDKVLKSYTNFCTFFSYPEVMKVKGMSFVKYEGIRNIDELKKLLAGKYLRRLAENVLSLPELNRIDVNAQLTKPRSHLELEVAWRNFETGKAKEHFSSAKANNALLKTTFTVEYVENLVDQGESVLVFTDHVDSAKYLHAKLNDSGLITGATKEVDRNKTIDDFQNKKIKILIGTIGTVSVGYTLTVASHVVFNDLSWVVGDNAQAEKRIHRIGQNKRCFIHRIFSSKIDQYIGETLTSKMRNLDKIL